MELFCEKFSLPIINDLMKLTLGQQLGRGVYRQVYEHGQNKNLVLKINNPDVDVNFANAKEWEVWMAVKETNLNGWFAPCTDISFGGLAMIQHKTAPMTLEELKKECPKVPAFFTDLKVGNWGRLLGKIVCHDYGNLLTVEKGLTKRLRVADWWE